MYSVSINVKGRVQGVGFRYSAFAMAKTYGLSGFVKNLTNGSVYIEASGDPVAVNDFIAWCRKGPARSRVEECTYEPIEKNHSGLFEIR